MLLYSHWTDITVHAFTCRTGNTIGVHKCKSGCIVLKRNLTDRRGAYICSLFHTDCTHTHTCAHTQSDDKRGHGAGRAVIYTVSTPSGHDVHFQKHMCRVWLRTYSTCMCSLCQKLTCACSLWKIYKRETPRVPMSVYLESVWGRGGAPCCLRHPVYLCVVPLWYTSTGAWRVLHFNVPSICKAGDEPERYLPQHPPAHTHARTHTHAHLNSTLEMSAVLSEEILRADERRTSSKTGALPPPLNYPSCN